MSLFASARDDGGRPPAGPRPLPRLVLVVPGGPYDDAARVRALSDRIEALSGIRPRLRHSDGRSPHTAAALLDPAGQDGVAGRVVAVPLTLEDGAGPSEPPAAGNVLVTPGPAGADALGAALFGRLRDAEERAGPRADAVVVAAERPGESVRASAARLAGLLGAVPVVVATGPAPTPGEAPGGAPPGESLAEAPGEAVGRLRAAGHRRVAVVAYALTAGRFTRSLSRLGAWAVTEPLADHPLTARLVLRRYAAALADCQNDRADQADQSDRADRADEADRARGTRPKPQSAE
ncbi:hypothetical protein J5Y04_31895 [Kitasatospora sp. RG8]|uniref:sirohydrochlorin chelatase n=1 Tax=Kitasatospora sp. RG8 TaxID=2820815 RepID=UPI001AE0C467|nr:hypothetical protein [Kitasatospora sp. RG8]MBP0454105.1 hypothetical protein [Kitasatospora sp. RG8]